MRSLCITIEKQNTGIIPLLCVTLAVSLSDMQNCLSIAHIEPMRYPEEAKGEENIGGSDTTFIAGKLIKKN